MKRKVLCILILINILLTIAIPTATYAVSIDKIQTYNSNKLKTDANNLIMQGANSFGKLLATELNQKTADKKKNNGCNIFEVKVKSNTATVKFETQKEAIIIVGVYDENGMQLETSGTAKINKGETQALIDLEEGKVPTYFYLKGFIVDNDMKPLCSSYESSYYTKDMQDFLRKTTDDFAQEKVLNLDKDKTKNYAIYNDKTKVIKQNSNNIIKFADETNDIYIFENIDDSICLLQSGDIFSYEYTNGEILIVKVSSININGSSATINGAKIEKIKEVFDYIRIDGNATTEDCEIKEIEDNGVTYNGMLGENTTQKSRTKVYANNEINGSISKTHSFSINKEYKSSDNVKIKISGEIENKIEVSCSYYETKQSSLLELKLADKLKSEVSVSGELKVSIPIAVVFVPIIPELVSLEFTPSFVVEVSGKIALGGTLETVIGFRVDNGEISNISSCPKWSNDNSISAEIKVFIGFCSELKINIISDKLASTGVELKAGVELSTQFEKEGDTNEVKHLCKKCIKGEIKGLLEFSVSANFLALESKKTFTIEIKLFDCYYSVDYNQFGLKKCPYKSYKVVIKVLDKNGEVLEGAKITNSKITDNLVTDDKGEATYFLKNGVYKLKVSKENSSIVSTVFVNGETAFVNVILQGNTSNEGNTGADSDIGGAKELKSGTCGDTANWILYDNGLLYIYGEGEMYNFSEPPTYPTTYATNKAPWMDDKENITKVKIEDGITSIGNYAFYKIEALKDVSVANTVTVIGGNAFMYCNGLTYVILPDSITTIYAYAFARCENLENAPMPKNLEVLGGQAFGECPKIVTAVMPDSLKKIHNGIFFKCTGLKSVTIPNNIKYLGENVFVGCTSLENIKLPDNLQFLGRRSFVNCTNLKSIQIPEHITEIEEETFYNCSNLSNIEMKNNVKYIQRYAMANCTSLRTIDIPESVKDIQNNVFEGCSKLESISLPKGVNTIANSIFKDCTSLKNVSFDGGTRIDSNAFENCTELNEITIPSNVHTIGLEAFKNCVNLREIYFTGKKPKIVNNYEPDSGIFVGVNANVYYPNDWDSIFTEEECDSTTIQWIPYTPKISKNVERNITQMPVSYKILSESANNNIKTVTFSDLVKGEEYILLVVKNTQQENLLLPDNLLYIAQGIADENGKISFTYIPKEINQDGTASVYGPSKTEPTVKQIEDVTVTLSNNSFIYTGSAIMPAVIIKDKDMVLKQGIDYTISYKNNKDLGTATVTITGKGTYEGTVEKTFNIVIDQAKGVVTKAQSTKSITVAWKRDTAVSGYEIYISTNKSKGYKRIATISKNSTTSYNKTKLKEGTTYYFKVRAYKTVGTTKKYGVYSSILTTTTRTKAPKISKVTAGKKKATVKWGKVTGATGYEIYMSTKKSSGYKKVGTNTKNNKISYTKTKLKRKKKYYFKVRTYRIVNGKKVYSSYSNVKYVKVK